MPNDGSDVAFSRGKAVPIGTPETLHGGTLQARADGLKLSLKLYQARELQLDYQQLITEPPNQKLLPLPKNFRLKSGNAGLFGDRCARTIAEMAATRVLHATIVSPISAGIAQGRCA